MSKKRVVLAMSGGVDSSVSAHLLQEQGYDVVGLFMRTGAHGPDATEANSGRKTRGCCSAVDAADARRVADRLDIPFYALNFEAEFGRIKDYFAEEYARGRTPNPCVVCNTWLKFGRLWDYASAVGADFIATGHYARVLRDSGTPELHRACDSGKDQSYFLFGLRCELLERILFPIGDLPKHRVREIAADLDLGVQNKPDSQEICFVPTGNYQEFLEQHRPGPSQSGEIVDHDGKLLGTHDGISRYTIGQRKGLGIAVGEPRYVLELQPATNRVVIGPQELLRKSSLEADGVNWLLPAAPSGPLRCQVKIRYLHHPVYASVHLLGDRRVRVGFDEPQSAITPGQAVVFYADTRVLGGGWIASAQADCEPAKPAFANTVE